VDVRVALAEVIVVAREVNVLLREVDILSAAYQSAVILKSHR